MQQCKPRGTSSNAIIHNTSNFFKIAARNGLESRSLLHTLNRSFPLNFCWRKPPTTAQKLEEGGDLIIIKIVAMYPIASKIFAVVSILIGLCSSGYAVHFLYQYNFTDKLWFYMHSTYHLVSGFILGIITIVNGIILLKHSKKINFYIAIISIAAILCLWLVFA